MRYPQNFHSFLHGFCYHSCHFCIFISLPPLRWQGLIPLRCFFSLSEKNESGVNLPPVEDKEKPSPTWPHARGGVTRRQEKPNNDQWLKKVRTGTGLHSNLLLLFFTAWNWRGGANELILGKSSREMHCCGNIMHAIYPNSCSNLLEMTLLKLSMFSQFLFSCLSDLWPSNIRAGDDIVQWTAFYQDFCAFVGSSLACKSFRGVGLIHHSEWS